MAEARKKLVKLTSPRITFKFPSLTEPDFGNKDYPKPEGVYKVGGVMDASAPTTLAFIKLLQPHHDAAVEEGKALYAALKAETRKKLDKQGGFKSNDLYSELLDKETEEPTGEIQFNFAMSASGEYKKGPKAGEVWHRKPALFDAKGTPMVGKLPSIWGGTIGKVSFELSPYFISGTGIAGLKLSLVGAQIIDLVSGGQKTAKDLGFGAEEGGYEAGTGSAEEDEEDEKPAKTGKADDDFGDDF